MRLASADIVEYNIKWSGFDLRGFAEPVPCVVYDLIGPFGLDQLRILATANVT